VPDPIRVVLAGSTGRTGREVGRAIHQARDMALVAAIGGSHRGQSLGGLWGDPTVKLDVVGSVAEAAPAHPQVLVDFTEPDSAYPRLVEAVERGWSVVVGTTGFSREQRLALARLVADRHVAAALIANFSVGSWMLEQFTLEAARVFSDVELIEAHADTKRDRPSGTAVRLSALLARAWRRNPDDIPVHSIRLPGMVAHQTVVFGAKGQVLTLRHDVHDRTAYASGVLMAIRRMSSLSGQLVEDLGAVLQPSERA
jgi:4-hydroxy-tetrahydrodipicolinate reductase